MWGDSGSSAGRGLIFIIFRISDLLDLADGKTGQPC